MTVSSEAMKHAPPLSNGHAHTSPSSSSSFPSTSSPIDPQQASRPVPIQTSQIHLVRDSAAAGGGGATTDDDDANNNPTPFYDSRSVATLSSLTMVTADNNSVSNYESLDGNWPSLNSNYEDALTTQASESNNGELYNTCASSSSAFSESNRPDHLASKVWGREGANRLRPESYSQNQLGGKASSSNGKGYSKSASAHQLQFSKSLPRISEASENTPEKAERATETTDLAFQGSPSQIPPEKLVPPPDLNVSLSPERLFLERRSFTLDSQSTVSSSGASQRLNLTLEASEDKDVVEEAMLQEKMEEEQPPSVLCCAGEEPQDFQIDLCPRSWFDLTESSGFCDAIWRIVFIILFLPLCYPCYLTRRCRRRSDKRLNVSLASNDCPTSPSPRKMKVIKAHRIEIKDTIPPV